MFPDIISGVFPAGQCHGLSGAAGAGKTALTAWMLKQISLGEPIFGRPTRPPAFIGVIVADRTWLDHKQWFELVGLPDIAFYSLPDDDDFDTRRLRKKQERILVYEHCIAKLAPPPDSLIFVDPASLFLGGDLLNYDTCAVNLIDIGRMCRRGQYTTLLSMHAGKQKGDSKERYTRPQDRILGTTALTGHLGTVFHLAPEAETGEDWAEFTWVPHHAPAATFRLLRSHEDGLLREMQGSAPTRREKQHQMNEERLLALFPAAPESVHVKFLVERATAVLGLKRAKVLSLLAQLAADGLVVRGEKRGEWRRPDSRES